MASWLGSDGVLTGSLITALLACGLCVTALCPRWIIRFPRSVLSLLALVTLVATSALVGVDPLRVNVSIDPSTEPLLPAGDPGQALYRTAVLDFGDDELYAIAVECGEVFSVECLSAIDRVSAAVARLEGVRSVQNLLDVTSFRYVAERDWIEIRPFIEQIPSQPAALAQLRERALRDPVYRHTLVAPDATAAAINLSFRKMSDAQFIASGLDREVREILERESAGDLRFYVAGRPHVKVQVYRGILRDLRLLIPLAILVMASVLWAFFGMLRGVLLPLGSAVAGNLWTFGVIAWLDEPLTLLTGLLPPTLLAIGSVYGVHVFSRYEEEAARAPSAPAAALRCLEHVRVPALIAGLTTVIGFAALLISDVPAVGELGLYSMLGIASNTLIALSGIPAVLALLPLRTAPVSGEADAVHAGAHARFAGWLGGGLDALLARLARGVAHRASGVVALCLALTALAVLAIPRIAVDTDYLSYFDEHDPVRLDFEAVNRLLAGAVPIYLVLEGTGPGSFREPDLLRAVQALQADIDHVPGVSRTLSFIDTLRQLNRAFQADDASAERVPDTRPGVTELLFMLPKAELSRFITVNHGRANLIVRTGEVGSAAILRLVEGLERIVADHPLPRGVGVAITGNTVLLSRSADGIARRQPWSVGLASAAIFLIIGLGLRSPALAAVAMIPNLIPVLVFFGALGFGLAPLSLPTSLIGSMALGIAIDDTAHFLVRYRAERRHGADPGQAALLCSRFVGRPIVITSLMLCAGFLVVMGSQFATLREFGALSAFTMAVCLVTDLVLLPAVLVKLEPR